VTKGKPEDQDDRPVDLKRVRASRRRLAELLRRHPELRDRAEQLAEDWPEVLDEDTDTATDAGTEEE